MAQRRVFSVQRELLAKSREAALNAVQTFNNPLTTFKTESFVVLMVIAWTYMLHAYYRREGIEYRYFKQGQQRRRFDRTASGAFKYWELERCLNEDRCPLDGPTKANLRFLIGLRHEIEHHMPTHLDEHLGGRYLACCLNYENWITTLFGEDRSLGQHQAFALQFHDLAANPTAAEASEPLPKSIARYIDQFDASIDERDFQSPRYSYRMIFTRKLVNHRGQADEVIEFISSDSELAQAINSQYVILKETERPKFGATEIVQRMHEEGFPRFTMHSHTQLWKRLGAKDPLAGFGAPFLGQWGWYSRWIDRVLEECRAHPEQYEAE